ncbi:hypothetical protein K0U07_00965 [bacterium]|nr:hypothetical protein [bacterium]
MWKIENSGKGGASFLMKKDQKMLLSLKEGDDPILHFYEFAKPSFTHGVFVDPAKVMGAGHKMFDFARRPTGGGVLFHVWDFAFSVFVPKKHAGYFEDVMECYKFVNERVIEALQQVVGDRSFSLLPEEPVPLDDVCKHFCFAKPTRYDIMLDDKKLAGAAQRRKGGGYLHQGSIMLTMPDFEQLAPLFEGTKVVESMQLYTGPLFQDENALIAVKKELAHKMSEVFNGSSM